MMLSLRKLNYRHYICIAILIVCILCSVLIFSSAMPRLVLAFKDFGKSVGSFFVTMLGLNNSSDGKPSDEPINEPPIDEPPIDTPIDEPPIEGRKEIIPKSYDDFKLKITLFFSMLKDTNNIVGYLSIIVMIIYMTSKFLMWLLPIILMLYVLFIFYLGKENNKYNKDSYCLKKLKRFSEIFYIPVKKWIISFIEFVRDNSYYMSFFLIIWAYNFNIFSIVITFLSYYFDFATTFNFLIIYNFVYRTFVDLTVMFSFMPVATWFILGLLIFDKIRKSIGIKILRHMEMKNRGFINALPVVTLITGAMGTGKNVLEVDLVLSQEMMYRDTALDLIIKNDLKFPYFPVINFENALKREIDEGNIYNLSTCEKYIDKIQYIFNRIHKNNYSRTAWEKMCDKKHNKHLYKNACFGYDFNKYGMFYNDNLKVINLFDMLKDYAKLYSMYIMGSSYIIANYSIRTDNIISDKGNFPLWDTDYLNRNPKNMKAYSRHSHILNFDMLRLGKKMVENCIENDAFDHGVIAISEIGKECKNMLGLKDVKAGDDNANQLNDLMNLWLKMARHACVINNVPFVKLFCDEQRASDLGSKYTDLANIVHIREKTEKSLTMPCFFLFELFYDFIFSKFYNIYLKYRYNRSDNTVFMWLFRGFTSKVNNYYERIYNQYGYFTMSLDVEKGSVLGDFTQHKHYISIKKVFANRYDTACFRGVFIVKNGFAPIGLNDIREYKTETATLEELASQNSYFVKDITVPFKLKKENEKVNNIKKPLLIKLIAVKKNNKKR